jgi:hypothetical protein
MAAWAKDHGPSYRSFYQHRDRDESTLLETQMKLAEAARIAWKPVGDSSLPGSRLRAYLPAHRLREAGWQTEIFENPKADSYGLVVFQKRYQRGTIALASRLKRGELNSYSTFATTTFITATTRRKPGAGEPSSRRDCLDGRCVSVYVRDFEIDHQPTSCGYR